MLENDRFVRDDVFSFPHEVYLDIENEPFFKGRIIVNKVSRGYQADIDIVSTESQRIYKHVGQVFEPSDAEEALDSAIYKLSQFLKTGQPS